MSEEFRTFRDLDCWKACRELRLFLAKEMVPVLPREEKYRLWDQILRAGRSATANIAEGYGRFHYLESAKFCSNARGSDYEALDHLITAHDEGLISDDLMARGEKFVESSVKLLNGYIRYLQNKSRSSAVREPEVQYPASDSDEERGA